MDITRKLREPKSDTFMEVYLCGNYGYRQRDGGLSCVKSEFGSPTFPNEKLFEVMTNILYWLIITSSTRGYQKVLEITQK